MLIKFREAGLVAAKELLEKQEDASKNLRIDIAGVG